MRTGWGDAVSAGGANCRDADVGTSSIPVQCYVLWMASLVVCRALGPFRLFQREIFNLDELVDFLTQLRELF